MTDTITMDTKDRIIALLIGQKQQLRIALEQSARNALAGNGWAESKQALVDDDRAEEQLQSLIKEYHDHSQQS